MWCSVLSWRFCNRDLFLHWVYWTINIITNFQNLSILSRKCIFFPKKLLDSILIILSYKLNFRYFPVFSNFYAKTPILTPKCAKSGRWISVNVNRLNWIISRNLLLQLLWSWVIFLAWLTGLYGWLTFSQYIPLMLSIALGQQPLDEVWCWSDLPELASVDLDTLNFWFVSAFLAFFSAVSVSRQYQGWYEGKKIPSSMLFGRNVLPCFG